MVTGNKSQNHARLVKDRVAPVPVFRHTVADILNVVVNAEFYDIIVFIRRHDGTDRNALIDQPHCSICIIRRAYDQRA